jgi:hypothetical protein
MTVVESPLYAVLSDQGEKYRAPVKHSWRYHLLPKTYRLSDPNRIVQAKRYARVTTAQLVHRPGHLD